MATKTATLSATERNEIARQVRATVGQNEALRLLPAARREEILRNTAEVVEAMATRPRRPGRGRDEYALAGPPEFKAQAIAAGVTQAARMVKEIDFPSFVANLIEGSFHAIVKSSIEQMNAYAEMVKSVAQSLEEFKDDNVTENQGKDHLVKKYPQIFQLDTTGDQPKVTMREGADDSNLPNFQKDLSLDEAVDSLDDETIANKLVPAAQYQLARGRQQLLATVILMGINRIVVTDGKINAKMRFQFQAQDHMTANASDYDYQHVGDTVVKQGGGDTWQQNDQGRWNYTKGQYQSAQVPDVRVTSEVHSTTEAGITASGQMMGEVSINFKSETFPLEKMVNTDQMTRLNQAQAGGAGRAAPPAPAPAAAPASAAPAPAPAPAAAAPAAR